MQSSAATVQDYLQDIPEERLAAFKKIREAILENMPEGFVEQMNYGMIGYVVPHSLYPSGYHCDPKLPLPFAALASQKNFIAFYHMGIYADQSLMDWFLSEYPKYSTAKLDMGKSCIRFKKTENIPVELLGKLMGRMTVKQWIDLYESKFRSS